MKRLILIVGALLAASPCFSQNQLPRPVPEEPKTWRLDFSVEELLPAKEPVSHTYSITISTETSYGSIRTGDKVPVRDKDGAWTFVDVGVNIDCRLGYRSAETLHLFVTAEISSVAGAGAPPLINQTKWSGAVTVPIGKSATVFTADGTTTKRQTKLEVTARLVP